VGIITRMRKQDAVYWPFTGVDAFGQKEVGSPQGITVRWDDVTEEFIDSEGERHLSNAKVYVGIDMVPGSILMLGVVGDITDAVNIKENAGAFEIKRFDKNPNLKATEFLRTAYL